MCGRSPTSRAAARAAPDEMPMGRPSIRATLRATAKAVSLPILRVSSIMPRFSTLGTKPAPMPWIEWGPRRPPDSTGLSSGSTAIIRKPDLRGLMTSAIPVNVPPVPTPLTTTSTLPSVSCQISSAVVRRWTSGLAGFSNCCSMTALGSSSTSSLARSTAPAMPLDAGVNSVSAPSSPSILRRSTVMLSGMVRIRRYPLAAQTNARAMPVLPDVGSTRTAPGPMRPSASAASIMARPMRSLTEARGLKNSHLPTMSAAQPASAASLLRRTSGVAPMVSRMPS